MALLIAIVSDAPGGALRDFRSECVLLLVRHGLLAMALLLTGSASLAPRHRHRP